LTVDEYYDAGWLTVVSLLNVRTRPRGVPGLFGMSFPSLNLRTYVTCDGEPGLYCFSLDAQSILSVVGGRLFHRLPYYYARMQFQKTRDRVQFESRRLQPGDRPARFDAMYEPHGDWYTAERGTLADFLTERRRLYTQDNSGRIRYTDVSHERWTLSDVTVAMRTNSLFRASGLEPPDSDPVHYYSPGLDVVTGWNKSWKSIER
jgi:uncharacterized protein YqjF (DUF2071 family)